MVSRLLESLDQRLKVATIASERISLSAERAGVLARLGRLDEARHALSRLREANADYQPLPTIQILLSEGMVEHYENHLLQARDKFRRAYAISSALGFSTIKVRSSAWLASNCFQLGNITASGEYAVEALAADDSDHSTLARANLAAADLYMFAGDSDLAKRHYRVARDHAIDEGDLSMQSSILFNYAAFRVHSAALSSLNGQPDIDDLRLVEREVSTPANLDVGIGNASLRTFVPLLQAQLLAICGRYSEALKLFQEVLGDAISEGRERELAKFYAYIAHCHLELGNRELALEHAAMCEGLLGACTDLDDLAIVHGRLLMVFAKLDPSRSQPMQQARDRCLSEFLDKQTQDRRYVHAILGRG